MDGTVEVTNNLGDSVAVSSHKGEGSHLRTNNLPQQRLDGIVAQIVKPEDPEQGNSALSCLSSFHHLPGTAAVLANSIDRFRELVSVSSENKTHAEFQARILVEVIAPLGRKEENVEFVTALLNNQSTHEIVKAAAVEALVFIEGRDSEQELLEIANQNEQPQAVKSTALRYLGLFKCSAAGGLFKKVCDSPDATIDQKAASASSLAVINDPQAVLYIKNTFYESNHNQDSVNQLFSAFASIDQTEALKFARAMIRNNSIETEVRCGAIRFVTLRQDQESLGSLREIPLPEDIFDKLQQASLRARISLKDIELKDELRGMVIDENVDLHTREQALKGFFVIAEGEGGAFARSLCNDKNISQTLRVAAIGHLGDIRDPFICNLSVDEYIGVNDHFNVEIGGALYKLDDSRGIELLERYATPDSMYSSVAVHHLLSKPDARAAEIVFNLLESTDIYERYENTEKLLSILMSSDEQQNFIDGLRLCVSNTEEKGGIAYGTYADALEDSKSLSITHPFRFSSNSLIGIVRNRKTHGLGNEFVSVWFCAENDSSKALLTLCAGAEEFQKRGIRIEMYEIKDKNDLITAKEDLIARHGSYQSKITVVAGHSSRVETAFGNADPGYAGSEQKHKSLSVEDEAWLKEMGFAEVTSIGGRVIVIGCAVGQGEAAENNIVNLIHKATPQAETVMGPCTPTGFYGFSFDEQNLPLPIFFSRTYKTSKAAL